MGNRTYQELLHKHTRARKVSDWEAVHETAACINIGLKLNWTKEHIVRLSERVSVRVVDFDHLRDKFDNIWEVDAEIERLTGKNHDSFSRLMDIVRTYSSTGKRAPLILIRVQAAINVAFWRTFGAARNAGQPFDTSLFESIAVYQFRVPGQEANDTIDYLLKQSNTGRYRYRTDNNKTGHKFALGPGTERDIRKVEKEQVIGAIISIDGGREVVEEALAKIHHKEKEKEKEGNDGDGDINESDNDTEKSDPETALEGLNDQSWLLLDHFVRMERGWGVLGTELEGVVLSHIVSLKYQPADLNATESTKPGTATRSGRTSLELTTVATVPSEGEASNN